jgi:RNA polymerase primary sigma factor
MSTEMLPPENPEDASFTVVYAEEVQVEERAANAVLNLDPVKDYLIRIGKTPLLNAEQEVELAKTIEAGLMAEHMLKDDERDLTRKIGQVSLGEELEWLAGEGQKARDLFIESNLRLVVSIAKKYMGRGMEFLDLIQEGNVGLGHAVEMFDYTKGYKFSTYATWWIRQGMTRATMNTGNTIRIPIHTGEKLKRLRGVRNRFLNENGRLPTEAEYAEELKLPELKIRELIEYDRMQPDSLDRPVGDGGGVGRGQTESTLKDLIEVPQGDVADMVAESLELGRLQSMLAMLTEREASIVAARFGINESKKALTLEDAGKQWGITRERARQIENEALRKLRSRAVRSDENRAFDFRPHITEKVTHARPNRGRALAGAERLQVIEVLESQTFHPEAYGLSGQEYRALTTYLGGGGIYKVRKSLAVTAKQAELLLESAKAKILAEPTQETEG